MIIQFLGKIVVDRFTKKNRWKWALSRTMCTNTQPADIGSYTTQANYMPLFGMHFTFAFYNICIYSYTQRVRERESQRHYWSARQVTDTIANLFYFFFVRFLHYRHFFFSLSALSLFLFVGFHSNYVFLGRVSLCPPNQRCYCCRLIAALTFQKGEVGNGHWENLKENFSKKCRISNYQKAFHVVQLSEIIFCRCNLFHWAA